MHAVLQNITLIVVIVIGNSKREEMKELIKNLKNVYDNVDINIFRSVQNVNLDTLISYRKGENIHHFLDDYNIKKED